MTTETYNFRRPGRLASDLEQRLGNWLRVFCARVPVHWAKHVPVALEMEYCKLETVRPAEGLARLTDAVVSYRILMNEEEMSTLLILPRPLTLALLAGLLGDAANTLPADRELTVVEEALTEHIIQNLFLALLQETWPGPTPLPICIQRKELNPKWTRMFSPNENVVVATFAVRGPFGEQEWYWMVPQKGLLSQLSRLTGTSQEPEQELAARPRLESLVRELPVEITVALGVVELPIAQLARLRPGDMVILDQRVSEPLIAAVAGQKRLRGWAGRVGSAQAFQVESLIEG
jgi:flagellar motor switch protein FliM